VSRTVTAALQVLLLLLLLPLVLVQAVVLPGLADDMAGRFPEAAQLRTPVLVLAVSTVGCVQTAVLCVAKLLSMVGRDSCCHPAAYRYADVLIGATAAASALVMGIGVYVSATTGSPLWCSCAVVAVIGAGTALLMVAWRDRLAPAAEQHPVRI